ncbi:hypothetical protein RhiTH_001651 [Rhizoctonia solani]|uniref:Uncharacterized protein n=1 Tax=Rhizoctonia solani TaxID=456999 RepID=A0A8H7H8H1_9AGAM|nr:hypothetical protein RHS04_06080 [Rhizoctonia solani]KAF8757800.1 hypothetical protein RHS01_03557 [Rhizoctonia solani]
MVRFTISSLVTLVAFAPIISADFLRDGTYRISCDPLRPDNIKADAPGRRFLAINSPNANATFSRYLNESRSPQWEVRKAPTGVEYTITSLSFKDSDLGYPSPAAGGVQVRGDNGTETNLLILSRWNINNATSAAGEVYFL